MIRIEDLIKIPFTPDLTRAGITYACRSLPHLYNHLGNITSSRLRRIISGVAVELAFRRCLDQQNIPFEVKSALPFTDPDRYDVSLGTRRCEIRSFLISHRRQITALKAIPDLMLEAPALVPLDQYYAENGSDFDIYLFAFLTGLITDSTEDLIKVVIAELPTYFIHTFPATWSRPNSWAPLGPLIVKSEADAILKLEIGGQEKDRELLTCSLELPPYTRCVVDKDFYSLAYLHVENKPDARLGVYSPTRDETYLVDRGEWHNIWVYGMEIYLAGWMSRSEFRRRAALIPESSRVFQYDHTHTKNLAVPISDLKPLSELFSRIHEWEALK